MAFAFLTRLPCSTHTTSAASLSLAQALRWAPMVGIFVAVLQWFLATILVVLQAPALIVGLAAVALSIWFTRGLHEDGLSDYVDGVAGGWTVERRLEIMKDSRVGAFGATALAISIGLRAAAIGSIATLGTWSLALALLLAGALSRVTFVILFRVLRPARPDGLSNGAGKPELFDLLIAGTIPLILLILFQPIVALTISLAFALSTAVFIRHANRNLGGHTGDVAGALQQVTELLILVVLSLGIWR